MLFHWATIVILVTQFTKAIPSTSLFLNPRSRQNSAFNNRSTIIDLSQSRNNKAFGLQPGEASFDQNNNSYPATHLPPPRVQVNGIDFDFPEYQENANDNVVCEGQRIAIPKGRYSAIHALVAGDGPKTVAEASFNATYEDQSTTSSKMLVNGFWQWAHFFDGDIMFPHLLNETTVLDNTTMIYESSAWLDGTKYIESLTLPNVTLSAPGASHGDQSPTRVHLFALSLSPMSTGDECVNVDFARSTRTWIEGTNKTQIVEVTMTNVGQDWITSDMGLSVSVESDSLRTTVPACVKRLRPADQAVLQVGVVNVEGVTEGSGSTAVIRVTGTGVDYRSAPFNVTCGIPQYEATWEDIDAHEAPSWYKGAKFGIFIHWGPYSVPGWGNSGVNETYAEWYWYRVQQGPNVPANVADIYGYNLQTYGPNHTYDEFFPQYTADAWNPKEWVDLFADAGAQYFVQVSKHHDGFSLFSLPENVSKRTSEFYGPQRNLLQELFDAATQYQPQLYPATYYSLPEWFNPSFEKYGFGSWPGGLAVNPYTNVTEPYTGYVEVDDYFTDFLLPSMNTLADMGTNIMWCDIGGPNMTPEFASRYFNNAAKQGRQVLMNDRCGAVGDHATPEYARYNTAQKRKWESSQGMDPYSYGYNRATPESAYLKPGALVVELLDIVSKNGNFLLDVGPQANGTIIQVEQDNLREAGVWIHDHAEAIYNTTYWYITPEENEIRFTQNDDAFYIISLAEPNNTVVLESPVPYMDGDNITVVGGNSTGTILPASLGGNGHLTLSVSDEVIRGDHWAWVFKIPKC